MIDHEFDGTFIASELPEELLYGPPNSADRLVTGSGNWTLVLREGMEEIQLEIDAIPGRQRGNIQFGTLLKVSRGCSATSPFYYGGGDAIQARRIEFEKM
jgi:hypothetical protein